MYILIFALLIPVLSFCQANEPVEASENIVNITVDRSVTIDTSSFSIGVTEVGDHWEDGNPKAVVRAKKLLANAVKYQNQHIMNWGVEDPEPEPDKYNWTSLDKRIHLIKSMDAIPIITFCTAPGWMKTSGQDNAKHPAPHVWISARVKDDKVGAFAHLCKKAALRYQDVKYFQIWNELKGYWSDSLNNWDYARYTKLYNAVYDSVKSVRPDAKIGGPYYPFGNIDANDPKAWKVIDYWFQHKHGADFVNFDGWIAGYPPSRDPDEEDEKMKRTDYFGKIVRKFRSRTDLPIWISEFYAGWSPNPQFTAANHASCYLHALLAGASLALLWGPAAQKWNYLFTSTKNADGGKPSPHYEVVKKMNKYFGPGTSLVKTESSSNDVEVLASPVKTMLINKRPDPVSITLNGKKLLLKEYEVRFVDTP